MVRTSNWSMILGKTITKSRLLAIDLIDLAVDSQSSAIDPVDWQSAIPDAGVWVERASADAGRSTTARTISTDPAVALRTAPAGTPNRVNDPSDGPQSQRDDGE